MQDIQPVRLSTHANLRWVPSPNYSFAAASLMAPIAMDELAAASVAMPLAFANPGNPTLIGLLGLRPRQNLFLTPDGRWLGEYLPAVFRGYPFKLLPAADDNWALAFDHSSGLIAENNTGEAFFTEEGKSTPKVHEILSFLVRLNAALKRSSDAALVLNSNNLLEPWPLKIRDGDKEVPVEGLLRVNEQKLATLDDASFVALRANGVLALAYAQLLSMANIGTLGKLARIHQQHAAQSEKHQQEVKTMFAADHHEDEIDWNAMLKDD